MLMMYMHVLWGLRYSPVVISLVPILRGTDFVLDACTLFTSCVNSSRVQKICSEYEAYKLHMLLA